MKTKKELIRIITNSDPKLWIWNPELERIDYWCFYCRSKLNIMGEGHYHDCAYLWSMKQKL